jgi:hypothetical protein
MGIKDVLGTISPVYGVATGKGAFGDLAPHLGIIPRALAKDREDEEKKKAKAAAGMPPAAPGPSGMKKGGKVMSSASKRGDGIAQRGKTRGKMV